MLGMRRRAFVALLGGAARVADRCARSAAGDSAAFGSASVQHSAG